MFHLLPNSLIALAKSMQKPLFIVGGAVRDFLIGFENTNVDWDICSPMLAEDFAKIATEQGFTVAAVYRNTGTVKLRDQENNDFEFSSFRSDEYVRGVHAPVNVFFTDDIVLDARRRDFTCNAVYYNVATQSYVDPLDGITAIRAAGVLPRRRLPVGRKRKRDTYRRYFPRTYLHGVAFHTLRRRKTRHIGGGV